MTSTTSSTSTTRTTRTVIENGYVATVDASGSEHARGHVVLEAGRILAVGDGPAPAHLREGAHVVDATGCLVTPGLINTHHHLYQWLTRGYAQDAILFDWLTALYPLWSRIDADLTGAGAAGAMAVLARSGCTTVGDHHYIFPAGSGDIMGALVHAAARVGVRLHATRGSMDLGASQGGLPPDFAVETTAAALAASHDAVVTHHDDAPDAMVKIAIAPCSPFSVTADLLREAAVLARDLEVRLHTHASETIEEDAYCAEHFGRTPTQYLEDLGWLGPDVWMAHCVHLDAPAIERYAATGTGVAHCPSSNGRLAAGIAPVRDLLAAGVAVGLGVDGAASNESGQLGVEIRESVLMNRLRTGADSLGVRAALRMATAGGARVLGRADHLGSLEVGKLADLVVWRVDGVEHAGILDPVAALGLGALPPIALSLVGGAPVVVDGALATGEQDVIAREVAAASRALAERA
ncbi:8-oxoguanine deaminase [Litorihabitans aurantiacus]|uniref:8-oxoguanine deaminase n=1 Tax=Litorihabitans aurantiacus TaxID=1930061 RepID=A0AA37UR68_9MICO|nr:8-oxoguanine deaminase [Litorihabitans aurantiacus]GMA30140.1 8-oxoguanine deaminase [Litorihabitans aurantiacus]